MYNEEQTTTIWEGSQGREKLSHLLKVTHVGRAGKPVKWIPGVCPCWIQKPLGEGEGGGETCHLQQDPNSGWYGGVSGVTDHRTLKGLNFMNAFYYYWSWAMERENRVMIFKQFWKRATHESTSESGQRKLHLTHEWARADGAHGIKAM